MKEVLIVTNRIGLVLSILSGILIGLALLWIFSGHLLWVYQEHKFMKQQRNPEEYAKRENNEEVTE